MSQRELSNILVIEDEADIRKILSIALGNMGGFDVELCASANEALQILPDLNPDLIILDVMMPVMDGPGFLEILHRSEQFKNIPVILLTAKVQPHEVDAYHDMGVLGVISKPFNPVSLSEQIKSMWQSTVTS